VVTLRRAPRPVRVPSARSALRSWRSMSASTEASVRARPAKRTAVRICAGRQALALGELGDEGLGHDHAFQRLAHELPSRAPGGGDFSSRW
jgi:hypothetical protein